MEVDLTDGNHWRDNGRLRSYRESTLGMRRFLQAKAAKGKEIFGGNGGDGNKKDAGDWLRPIQLKATWRNQSHRDTCEYLSHRIRLTRVQRITHVPGKPQI